MSTCSNCGLPTQTRLCQECRLDDLDLTSECSKCGANVVYVEICDDCSDLVQTARTKVRGGD